jgi:CubicO group peptidase (beta-lactamase class C family)
MARKVNHSKEKRRSKRKDRVDYTAQTMAKLKELEQAGTCVAVANAAWAAAEAAAEAAARKSLADLVSNAFNEEE